MEKGLQVEDIVFSPSFPCVSPHHPTLSLAWKNHPKLAIFLSLFVVLYLLVRGFLPTPSIYMVVLVYYVYCLVVFPRRRKGDFSSLAWRTFIIKVAIFCITSHWWWFPLLWLHFWRIDPPSSASPTRLFGANSLEKLFAIKKIVLSHYFVLFFFLLLACLCRFFISPYGHLFCPLSPSTDASSSMLFQPLNWDIYFINYCCCVFQTSFLDQKNEPLKARWDH